MADASYTAAFGKCIDSPTATHYHFHMANGSEDLEEKNKDAPKASDTTRFSEWASFQGREDAEMLAEKQISRTRFRSRRDYEREWEE